MDVSDVKNQIRELNIQPFYIFTGEEWKVQEIYTHKIAEVSGKKYRYVHSISDVWHNITNSGLFAKPCCYVVRDDVDILQNEKLQEQLTKDILQDNIIILLLTNIDKRTKFYKKYKDNIVEFKHLKPEILKKYIKKVIYSLSDATCDKLMKLCNYDYGRCLLEIDKIKHHAKATQAEDMPNNVFELLLFDGTIYTPPKDAIFDFVDCILNADSIGSFKLYDECIRCGEATLVMLSVLYNNAKAVLQVQSCESSNIEKVTGLTYWQINNAKNHLRVFSNSELIDIMRICQECESGIKSGTIDEQYAMKYVLNNIEW